MLVSDLTPPKASTPASWRPGVSGNPSGRPKRTEPERQAEALAKEKCPQAMRKLVSMIESPKTTEAGRLRAIELLLDRALGKPIQQRIDAEDRVLNVTITSHLDAAQPVPGVLNSPVVANVQLSQGLRLVSPIETIEEAS